MRMLEGLLVAELDRNGEGSPQELHARLMRLGGLPRRIRLRFWLGVSPERELRSLESQGLVVSHARPVGVVPPFSRENVYRLY